MITGPQAAIRPLLDVISKFGVQGDADRKIAAFPDYARWSMLDFRVALTGILLAMTGPEDVSARSLDRAVVRMHCTGGKLPVPQRQGLCRKTVQFLMQVIPQAAPRMVPADQWQPRRPQDISVRLEIHGAFGKLLWQQGPMGELHAGPDIPWQSTKDCGRDSFAERLVTSTRPLLTSTLK